MKKQRKVVLYIAMSLDGFIADKNDGLDFLNTVQIEGEDYGYNAFIESVDTVIIGRKTFDKVVSLGVERPHSDKRVYIISRTNKPVEAPYHYFQGDLRKLIAELKSKDGLDIFCDGGAEVVTHLLEQKLIDEMVISIIPTLLGDGIRLFKEGRPLQEIKLVSTQNFESGLVQLRYELNQ